MSDAVSSFAKAVQAYNRAAADQAPGLQPREGDGEGGGFADMVRNAIEHTASTGQRAEQTTIAAAAQQADLHEVVTAVAEAEVTLQTVVAVRDKVIEAYRDIIRMPM